ncbi:MAG: AMP-binding protein, partial [Alphaproteobacteria bacterium]|nr:AMP-binding protein [Alphaproteobacteria bacterium]
MKKKEYEMMQQDNVACRKKKSLLPSPVFQYFEQIALDDPKKCAVINKQSSITYGDLLNDVLQLSHALQKIGVTTGNTVISTLTPSLNLIKLQLALHHLRATYLPIDPCFPKKRIEFIVKEVTPILLFAESKNLDKFLGITPSITVDQILKNERRTPLKLEKRKPDNKVAYISYTSGSTGTPKGVQVTYNNFLSLLHSVKEELPFTRSSTMLFFSKPWFDITNVEIFLPLLNGASIAIPPKESFLNGKSLSKFLNSTKTTVMQTTPSIWHILIDSGLEKHPQITSISTGEELTQELNQSLHSHFKRVWNFYGPTECTIYATASCTAPGSKPSIGTPLQNTQILILTPEGKETKKGEAGEIYIGGQGVSAGYLKRPKETK